jgi:hypothetical protein
MANQSLPECLGAGPPNFDFPNSLGKIIIGFLGVLPDLAIKVPELNLKILAEVPPGNPLIEIPKIMLQDIILPAFKDLVPPIKFTLEPLGDFSIESPNVQIPSLDIFDPASLIDFVVGLLKVAISLPEMILTPPSNPIDAIAVLIKANIPTIDFFKDKFSECLAKQIAGAIGLA